MPILSRNGFNQPAPDDRDRTRPFINLVRTARPFAPITNPWTQDGGVPTDAAGWPLDDFVLFLGAHQVNVGGEYRYRFTGRAKFTKTTFGVVSQQYDAGSNITSGTLHMAASSVKTDLYVFFTATQRGDGRKGVTDLQVLRPGYESDANVFTDQYLLVTAPSGLGRFMDATLTVGNTVPDFARRNTPSTVLWSRGTGWPAETILQYGRRAGKVVWICLPPHWDDASLGQLAALVCDQTAPDQRVRIAYGNEVWDPAKDAYRFNVAQAVAQAKGDAVLRGMFDPTVTETPDPQYGWCRSAEQLVKFRRMLGPDDPRFAMVYETQLGWGPIGKQAQIAYAYIAKKYPDRKPNQYLPRVALGGYYGPGDAMNADGLTPAGVAASTLAAAKSEIVKSWVAQWRAIGRELGVVIDLYEYGQDLRQFPRSVDAKVAAQSLPDTAAAVSAFASGWFSGDPDTVGCHYTLGGEYDQNSYFPLTDDITQLGGGKYAAHKAVSAQYTDAPLAAVTAPPPAPTVGTPYWSDVKTGGPRPVRNVTADPVRLADIGPAPRIVVPATSPWLHLRVLNDQGKVAGQYDKLDKFPPFCPGPDDQGMVLDAGRYTIEATPTGQDGNPSGPVVNFPLVIAAAPKPADSPATPQSPAPDPVVNTPAPITPPAPATGTVFGAVDLAKASYPTLAPLVDGFGFKSLRVWWTPDFNKYARDDETDNAMTFAQAGYDVLWTVAGQPVTPDSARNAPAWFAQAADDLVTLYDADPRTRGRQIRLQFLNEPDLTLAKTNPDKTKTYYKPYWTGTVADYAALLAKVYAAAKARHPDRIVVYAAGFSWDIANLTKYAPQIAAACDALAFHGYPETLDDKGLADLRAFAALGVQYGKPTCLDEAAPSFSKMLAAGRVKTDPDRAAQWSLYIPAIRAMNITEAILFAARCPPNSTNGAGSLFTADWKLTTCGAAVEKAMST